MKKANQLLLVLWIVILLSRNIQTLMRIKSQVAKGESSSDDDDSKILISLTNFRAEYCVETLRSVYMCYNTEHKTFHNLNVIQNVSLNVKRNVYRKKYLNHKYYFTKSISLYYFIFILKH